MGGDVLLPKSMGHVEDRDLFLAQGKIHGDVPPLRPYELNACLIANRFTSFARPHSPS
jgi:hypothetical protein